jgi:predicted transcriptional regulator of viral defense system
MKNSEKYLENLQMRGQLYFTLDQLKTYMDCSTDSALHVIHRLKKKGDVISPAKGLYVIVPIRNKAFGSIPAQDLVPILMKYLETDYYVACLSAGLYHGATHQKPNSFQIITNKRIKKKLRFGKLVLPRSIKRI